MKETFDLIKEKIMQDRRIGRSSLEAFLEILKEVEAEYGNGWIDVRDRLPENDDDVLVWYEFKAMQGTHVGERMERYGVGWFYKRTKSWLVDTTHGGDYRVIAWIPLPSPFKPTTD